MEHRIFNKEIAGKTLSVEVGKFAPLTDASVMVSYSETQILVHATSSTPREGIDFFPLSCEFQEKLYAVGRIPGGYLKREGRPSEKSVLASRLMDRPIRPLFPSSYKNDLQLIAQVMGIDGSCSPEILAIVGASCALSLAEKVPFQGPIGAVHVGYIDGEILINPDDEQMQKSELSLSVAGTKDAVLMVEAEASFLTEDTILSCIMKAHEVIKDIVAFIEEIQRECGIVKKEWVEPEPDVSLEDRIKEIASERVLAVYEHPLSKEERQVELDAIKEEVSAKVSEELEDYEERQKDIAGIFKQLEKKTMRSLITERNLRPDGRNNLQIRPLTTEINLIKRTHGSGYFRRGLTSALSITTLGALGEAQRLDGIEVEDNKRFMHHYNFPQFSVGETGPNRGPNRRAIGHGALGEKALLAVIPDESEFPYAIRVVSEVLSSNGSTSQASICAATMSMLSAGVPLKAPVAGIAMGLIKEEDKVTILSDIQGVEDFLGDMDFKVAGTKDGITAIQMDMKISGISEEILKDALAQAKEGRLFILNKMNETISEPAELSPYAPRVEIMYIHPDKIREVIGSGGKTITRITTEHNVKMDIDDDGKVVITGETSAGALSAKAEIESIVREIEVGEEFDAKIVRIAKFGAFVELTPNHEALVHISELTTDRLKRVEDKFSLGDIIHVKVIDKDDDGKISASVKALLQDEHKKEVMEVISNLKVGDIVPTKIVKIMNYGAFVRITDGVDALCHISELTQKHLKRVEDEFKVGDEIVVKIIGIDGDRISTSRKALLEENTNEG